jgi:hypothetical protein
MSSSPKTAERLEWAMDADLPLWAYRAARDAILNDAEWTEGNCARMLRLCGCSADDDEANAFWSALEIGLQRPAEIAKGKGLSPWWDEPREQEAVAHTPLRFVSPSLLTLPTLPTPKHVLLTKRASADLSLQLTDAIGGRLRELLAAMRETGASRRYYLVSAPEVTTEKTDSGGLRIVTRCQAGLADEIPEGFRGEVYDLTEDALARCYELIDAEQGRKEE